MRNRFVVFSDLHAHTHKSFSTTLSNGRNSRLQDAIDCVEQIHEYCMAAEIDKVLFLGDVFETKSVVPWTTLNPILHSFEAMARDGIEIAMLAGNHDLSTQAGDVHALEIFRHTARIVDNLDSFVWDDIEFYAIPFFYNVDTLKKKLAAASVLQQQSLLQKFCVQLLHIEVSGAYASPDFILYGSIKDHTCNFPEYDLTLMGHFHKHQVIKGNANAVYVGAPYSRHIGECGVPKGFLDVVLDEKLKHKFNYTFIPTHAPSIYKIQIPEIFTADTLESTDIMDNYVFAEVPDSVKADSVKQALLEKGARAVETAPVLKTFESNTRIPVSPTDPLPKIVKTYIEAPELVKSVGKLDSERLLKIGVELLNA